jgi:peroxiredoxin
MVVGEAHIALSSLGRPWLRSPEVIFVILENESFRCDGQNTLLYIYLPKYVFHWKSSDLKVSFLSEENYSVIRQTLTYLILLAVIPVFSQNVVIRGKAHPSYAGRIIQLVLATDYITNHEIIENTDTIADDGFFELRLQSEFTRPVRLKIDNITSTLYVQPDYVYGITIPEADPDKIMNRDVEAPVNISIVGADSSELNMLIIDYQEQFNKLFIGEKGRFLSRATMFRLADSLQEICEIRYRGIKNEYFKSYLFYSIAAVNASVSRGENFLLANYILNRRVQYHHHEYMQFFNACFKGYLNVVASRHAGQSLYNIINVKESYTMLDNFLKQDVYLVNDTIRELVIIKNFWDFYFSADFVPEAVAHVLSDVHSSSKIKEHRAITGDMLAYINHLQVGAPAPDFSARNRDGKMTSLGSFKNRWVYLNFFSTRNTESLREMLKIAALRKKYGDKVVFISVCLDDSMVTYKNYLRQNPRMNWLILFNNDKSLTKTARDQYSVVGTEAYFLINNSGYLAQSPAISPSAGIEFRFNIIFRIKTRTTKTGIR